MAVRFSPSLSGLLPSPKDLYPTWLLLPISVPSLRPLREKPWYCQVRICSCRRIRGWGEGAGHLIDTP